MRIENLPVLAWGAVFTKEQNSVVVYCGVQIEIRDQVIIEGAWNDCYENSSPLDATVVCGSGGMCFPDHAKFWAGTDNIYPLYSVRKNNQLFLSNSAVFVMSLSTEQPHSSYPFYYEDFISIVRLGFKPDGKLRLASKNNLNIHFSHILEIDRNLNVSFHRHPDTKPLTDFKSYRSLLGDSISQVLENAGDFRRQYPYSSIAACSKGYDANAIAVLAAEAGCTEAITFCDSKRANSSLDSGEEIARYLNLKLNTVDRWAYMVSDDLIEFAIVPYGMSSPYKGIENQLKKKILITGHTGDSIWGIKKSAEFVNSRASWAKFNSGYGLLEYRLRIGMIVFPPCQVGSIHNHDIHRIMTSKEMQPWSIGGKYDRPIPRRILEDAGINRGEFGMKKYASSQVNIARSGMHPESFHKSYDQFMTERREIVGILNDNCWRLLYKFRNILIKRLSAKKYRIGKITGLQNIPPYVINRPVAIKWYYVFYFLWSFNHLKERYVIKRK